MGQEADPVEVAADGIRRVRVGITRWLHRAAVLAAISPLLLGIAEVAFKIIPDPMWLMWWKSSLLVALFGAPGFVIAAQLVLLGASALKPGTITADGNGLVVRTRDGDTTKVPREQIVAGVVRPTKRGAARAEVVLANDDRLIADVASPADADRLLAASGLDPSRRTATVIAATPFMAGARALGAGVLSVLGSLCALGILIPQLPKSASTSGVVPFLFVLVTTLLGFVSVRASRPVEAQVGKDGVLIKRPFGKTFVSFNDVTSAHVDNDKATIILDRADGSSMDLVRFGNAEHLDALLHRVRAALVTREEAHEKPTVRTTSLLETLARQGRTIEEWRRALRDLWAAGDSFRSIAVDREELLRVVDDAEVPLDIRTGAALALREANDPQVGPRLRIAAQATASPHLRVALDSLAEDDLDNDAIAEALTKTEATSPQT